MANWQSYIPDYLAEQLTATPAPVLGQPCRFDAVVLFADVSGFTAISEALGKSGRSGTEELTTILNRYFEPMIALIRSFGGIIGKFGGDAMTVLFPFTAANRMLVVAQAIQCALDMQARMSDYKAIPTSAGMFELAMKAGLAAGSLFTTVVGDPHVRLEYVIAGTALDQCADAEHHATRGEVVVHRDLLGFGAELEIGEMRDAFALVTGISPRAGTFPLAPHTPLAASAIQTISMFLHPTISQRVREDLTSFINEHRKVTVLFVRFENLDYDHDSHVGEALQKYFAQVVEVVNRYDGYLNKIDMGDKGSKYIVVFGAPIAHEDDVERALQCALDLQDIEGFSVRIGVNTGFVYCGLVGSPMRQEYTVMGDVVNLSARLMQASKPGQILIGEDTYTGGNGFTWISLPAIQVKGKAAPVAIHALKGRKTENRRLQETQYTLPMVGRAAELRLAQRLIRRTLEGRGQVLGITADAGMGKSRLSAEIIRLALASGLSGYGGECVSHGTKTSYLVWHNILRGFFDLNALSTEAQINTLTTQLSEVDPELVLRVPLLREAVNLPIPHNELTQAMDAHIRKGSLENLIVDCLRYRAENEPLLLVLEDAHWIDPLSNDLLETVARNLADVPVMILVIYRPPEGDTIHPHVQQFGHFTEIRLEEFAPTEAAELIGMKLQQLFHTAEVPETFVQRIVEQAGGNPFFVDEMINLIHDRGIDPADPAALETLILPDSLNSLIISRIDQLSEGPKTTLKVASVIGRLFRAAWLWGIYPQLGSSELIKAQLEQLDKLEITPLDKPEPELEYLFKHILTREVAYESLAVATRQMLHEQVGHYIETYYQHDLEQFTNVLAYHYGASQNTEKQREYFYKAGLAAHQSFANAAAMDYYQRLLPLLPENEKISILLRLGDVLQLVGNWDETEKHFHEALLLAEKSGMPRDLARAQRAYGDILSRKGAYTEALSFLERAKASFEQEQDASGLDYTMRLIGVINWRQGDYDAALRCFDACSHLSRQTGNLKGAYRAIGNIGLIHKIRGDLPEALARYEEAQRIAHEIGDQLGEGIIIGNMGNVYLQQRNHIAALSNYSQYLQYASKLGYRQGISIAIGNMGKIYWYMGNFREALACNLLNLQIALEVGDRLEAAKAASVIAMSYMELGQFPTAERVLAQAIQLGRLIEASYDLADFLFNQANLLSAQGKPEEALAVLDETLQLAADTENASTQFEVQLSRLRTQVQLGQKDAQTAIAQLHHLRETWMEHFHGDEEQEAAIHYEIWKLDLSDDFHRLRAQELYLQLYQDSPNTEFRARYEELAHEQLPTLPPLPPLPDIVTRKPIQLDTLLEQMDALLQETQASAHAEHGHSH